MQDTINIQLIIFNPVTVGFWASFSLVNYLFFPNFALP